MCIRDRFYPWEDFKGARVNRFSFLSALPVIFDMTNGPMELDRSLEDSYGPVSYTHLDVYKRQPVEDDPIFIPFSLHCGNTPIVCCSQCMRPWRLVCPLFLVRPL